MPTAASSCVNDAASKCKQSINQVGTLLEDLTEARQDYSLVDTELKRLINLQSDLEVLRTRYRSMITSPQSSDSNSIPDFVSVEDWSTVDTFVQAKKQQWQVQHKGPMPRLNRDGQLTNPKDMLSEDEDDIELSVSEVRKQTRCPITQRPLEKTVKSTLCGHLFSEAGIRGYLRDKGGECLCPIAGCAKRIKASNLESVIAEIEEDNKIEFKLF